MWPTQKIFKKQKHETLEVFPIFCFKKTDALAGSAFVWWLSLWVSVNDARCSAARSLQRFRERSTERGALAKWKRIKRSWGVGATVGVIFPVQKKCFSDCLNHDNVLFFRCFEWCSMVLFGFCDGISFSASCSRKNPSAAVPVIDLSTTSYAISRLALVDLKWS